MVRKDADNLARIANSTGAVGSVVAALSCAMCFPALASIGAVFGLGFLAQYEGVMLNLLLPLFAGVAFAANALGYFLHRQWHRSLLGILGPTMVVATLYPLWEYTWSTYLLYVGLVFMGAVAILDLVWPANRRCIPEPAPQRAPETLMLHSTLTCPQCGYAKLEAMPTDACLYFYDCTQCRALLRPKPGDCCVFCSYGDMPCPPVQITGNPAACCPA